MGRTTPRNKSEPNEHGEYKQPWSHMIGAVLEIIEFDDEDPQKITQLGFRLLKGRNGQTSIVWVGVNFKKLEHEYNFYLY